MPEYSRLEKWRLILGKAAEEDKPEEEQPVLEPQAAGMDAVLDALYDSDRRGGLGKSSPNINRWLGDIRRYFPQSVVQIMQKDALERLGLTKMLLEPELLESVEPDIHLVSALMNLNQALPEKTRETAKAVIAKLVEQLQRQLRLPLLEAIHGSLSRSVRNRRPRISEVDWNRTIRLNLKHYQPEYKCIIPEKIVGFGRRGEALKKVILLIDQSASMTRSLVYAAVLGGVMASIRSIQTQLIFFDTNVVDMSAQLEDPVSLLFGAQLGGGTDIRKALAFAEQQIQSPNDTILILISDLYEGGNVREMLAHAASIKRSGATFITLLALSDQGVPSYDKVVASKFADLDIPVFASTPELFPDLMAKAIKGEALGANAG